MSLTGENGMSAADMAAVLDNNDNGFGNNGAWWVLLFLFAMNGGWGNGWGGNDANSLYPYMLNNTTNGLVQGGFDTAALTAQLGAIETSISNGQLADLNRSFDSQVAITTAMNGVQSALQQCCCNNQFSTADLKYTVATEACADRSAISNALRDVLEANNASTQRILDQMCQDKIDAKNDEIASLRTQLNLSNLAASQNAQTAAIIANNEAQTAALERYLAPTPIPAYTVPNPNGCGCNSVYNGCCGGVA